MVFCPRAARGGSGPQESGHKSGAASAFFARPRAPLAARKAAQETLRDHRAPNRPWGFSEHMHKSDNGTSGVTVSAPSGGDDEDQENGTGPTRRRRLELMGRRDKWDRNMGQGAGRQP